MMYIKGKKKGEIVHHEWWEEDKLEGEKPLYHRLLNEKVISLGPSSMWNACLIMRLACSEHHRWSVMASFSFAINGEISSFVAIVTSFPLKIYIQVHDLRHLRWWVLHLLLRRWVGGCCCCCCLLWFRILVSQKH